MNTDTAIVMLAHNGVDFTKHALESILGAKTLPDEMFLVDNCSSDATPQLIQDFAPRLREAGIAFTTWRNSENVGCSLARNQAWEKVQSKYTVFMDNDAAVCTADWLARMKSCFQQDDKLAILGPKIIYPFKPHCIQSAGVSFNRAGRVSFLGRGTPRDNQRFASYGEREALISACWLMRTDLRTSIGMLDELYHPVQYEDLDLCMRARFAGMRVCYTPDVEIYHFEGMTTASVGQAEYASNIARNSLKFKQAYKDYFPQRKDLIPAEPEDFVWLKRQELPLTPELDLRYN
ncbi:MAG: glycosyltransferase [Victivallales bacterium]|nr:glycosyltransferase [Victivallales bacterium]